MKKFKILSILLLLSGIVCFGIAGFAYWNMQNVREIFAYHGASERMFLSNPEMAEMFANLRFGIVKFSILGTVSWVLGLLVYLKRNKLNEIFNK